MKMYIGNLSFQTNEEDLQSLFASFGDVRSTRIILDRETGRSRGFGFVEMEEENNASEAMSQLNGSDFQGRRLVVNEARPRTEMASGDGRGDRW